MNDHECARVPCPECDVPSREPGQAMVYWIDPKDGRHYTFIPKALQNDSLGGDAA